MGLEYLTRFNNEYYKGFLKKDDPDSLHNTPRLYKDVNDRRNAVRRDTISAARSGKSWGKKGEPYQPMSLVEAPSDRDFSYCDELEFEPELPEI